MKKKRWKKSLIFKCICCLSGFLLIVVLLLQSHTLFFEQKEKAAGGKIMTPITRFEVAQEGIPEKEPVLTEPNLVAPSASIPTPDVAFKGSAAGAIRISGERLFAWEIDKRWPAASLTKLLTAVVAFESLKKDDLILFTDDIIATEGESGGFIPGEVFTLNDSVGAMLVVSSNDAGEAIASNYGRDRFITKMNQWAKEIGMENSVFVDPTGLSIHNRTTIQDIERLVQYIYQNHSDILAFTTKPQFTITSHLQKTTRTLYNINIFAGRDDFIGGKTGYIPSSGGNLVSIFRRLNDTVIITVFGTVDRFQETENILHNL
ncbi:MAG: serine hydrolase [bacterium]